MTHRIETLADILHPVTEAEFYDTYYDRKPLHVPASDPDKFAGVMSWQTLTALLNMTAIWSPKNLQLVLDTKPVPAEQYCRQAVDRNNLNALQPDAEMVKDWLRRGASIVANDIDTLTPGLAAAANALETATGGKVQSNLYCSWNQRQAFSTHFDTHDVFALHAAGEKVWRVYEGRLDRPIANQAFKSLDDDYHRANRGAVQMEVLLKPGDLLYIPRGQYHDALASSAGCIHLAYGVTRIIGVDALSLMFERAMADPLFRTNIPDEAEGPDARRAWLHGLADRFAELGRDDALAATLDMMVEGFHYPRGGFDLPADVTSADKDSVGFSLTSDEFAVVKMNGKTGLRGPRGALPIPAGLEAPVCWIVDRKRFTRAELAEAFPQMPETGREKLLGDLSTMRVIGPA